MILQIQGPIAYYRPCGKIEIKPVINPTVLSVNFGILIGTKKSEAKTLKIN
jgi:hypothetical protein